LHAGGRKERARGARAVKGLVRRASEGREHLRARARSVHAPPLSRRARPTSHQRRPSAAAVKGWHCVREGELERLRASLLAVLVARVLDLLARASSRQPGHDEGGGALRRVRNVSMKVRQIRFAFSDSPV